MRINAIEGTLIGFDAYTLIGKNYVVFCLIYQIEVFMDRLEIFRLLLIILLFENNERRDENRDELLNINQILIFFLLFNPFEDRRNNNGDRCDRRDFERDTTF